MPGAATLIVAIRLVSGDKLFKPLDFAPIRFYGRTSCSFYLRRPVF
jgi:hypothetical protein